MRRIYLYRFLLVAAMLIFAASTFIPISTADAAADQKWIKQVWSGYTSYNQKTVNAYKAYQQQIDKTYKQLYDTNQIALKELERKVLEDQKRWNEKLKADLKDIEKLYENNRDKTSDLRRYRNYISPTYLKSPMWNYTKEASRTYLNSAMWKLDKELSDTYLKSYMWTYNKTISPTYVQSAAWKMKNNVSDSYVQSYMWKLRNASSESYVQSPIWKYRLGKITKAQAQKQYNALYKQHTEALANYNAARKKEITNMANSTKKKVDNLFIETKEALEKQREETLLEISEARIELTGEGLKWEPLLITP